MPRETFTLNVLDPADFRRHRDVVAFMREGPFGDLMAVVSTFAEFPGPSAKPDAKRENRLRPARTAAWGLADDLQTVALAAVSPRKPRARAFKSPEVERDYRIGALESLTVIMTGLREADDDGYVSDAVLELVTANAKRLAALECDERTAPPIGAAAQEGA